METANKQAPTIAIVPTPGMGHLIPLAELATRLHLLNFPVTFIIPTDGSPMKPQKAILNALPKPITSIFLPPANFSDLPEDTGIETRISLSLTRSLPALRDAIRSLSGSTRSLTLIVDLFGTDAFDVAAEFGVPSYIFLPTSAMVLSFLLDLPELDRAFDGEFRDLPDPVRLPGCEPVWGVDMAEPVQDRKGDAYKWVLHHAKRYNLAKGFMVNSILDLEPGTFEALKNNSLGIPVYPIGPLVRPVSNSSSTIEGDGLKCLKWLDDQPRGSVLFVSFGSGGTISSVQLNELTIGLEMSGQRFLWVARSPNEKTVNSAYFNNQSAEDPFNFLPKGFVERTKGLGLVVSSWAPQVQVLSHSSTGGFLTHCGWNSTLESIVQGVPLIAWPLFAEQKMNAVMLSRGLKVALRVEVNKQSGMVERDEVSKCVKALIVGEEGKLLSERMKKMKKLAQEALGQGGASSEALAQVAQIWKSQLKSI